MELVLGILLAVVLLIVALFAFWIFAIAPRIKNKPDLSLLRQYDYAHRGLHGGTIPENSMAAFRLAADKGFGMELDLHLTADGQVVVHHDNDVSRLCGVDKRISDMGYKELMALRLEGTEEKIPLLFQVLEAVAGRTPLIVELKGFHNREQLCEKTWALLSRYQGPYCIESFNPLIVEWFKEHQPQVIRGQLMSRFKKGDNGISALTAFLGRNLFSNLMTRPDFEAYDYKHRNNPGLRLARRLFSMQEVSWTVRDPETYRRLKAEGCICIFEGFDPEEAP